VVLRPALQKHEHAQTTTLDGAYFGEFKYNGTCVSLQGDSFAQFESRVALHNSAFALNDRQVPNVIDIDFQHDLLLVACSVVLRARGMPFLYFVQDAKGNLDRDTELPA
jgi:hypothetical protein